MTPLRETVPRTNTVLWAANVRTKSVADRVIAARAGGFGAMSAFPLDLVRLEDSGQDLVELGERLRAAGCPIAILDPLTTWTPRWAAPAGIQGDDLAFIDIGVDRFFRMAAAIGVESISVIDAAGVPFSTVAGAEHLGDICDRAADHGWQVHLEFIPHTAVPDLRTAWELVERAGRPNLGLVFDVWHYLRGRRDDELLRSIPGERVLRVQLSDGAFEPVGDFANDLLHHRLPPGEGELELGPVVETLAAIGALDSVGPEVFSDDLDRLDPETVGRRVAEATLNVLPPAAGEGQTARELTRLDARWTAAHTEPDATAMDDLLDDAYLGTGHRGNLVDKADYLAIHADGQPFARFELSRDHLRVAGDTAVATGELWMQRSEANHARYTATYARTGATWRILAWQETPVRTGPSR